MQTLDTTAEVANIMTAFASRTGLTDTAIAPQRYLWTDAHAVCTLLSLYRATGDDDYRRLAQALIGQVHNVLGRHRADDPRDGWISGLGEAEGRQHPTAGGLRIGKKLGERRQSDPFDERLEWERDGQYFHYLTKWMHALCRAAAVIGEATYSGWARELAEAAFAGFVVSDGNSRRLRWKMSIDLSYPLVASSGHHDPLDGYITFHETLHAGNDGLKTELAELAGMVDAGHWTTSDPLGIGGLLFDACRVIELTVAGELRGAALARTLVMAALQSLAAFEANSNLAQAAAQRLAFRELGLSIGLHAIDRMHSLAGKAATSFDTELMRMLDALRHYSAIAKSIEAFWLEADNQQSPSWHDHADINAVTLATSLLPDEFLAV
jgi:ribosomal protein S18 acetylase RimI-like enzyme